MLISRQGRELLLIEQNEHGRLSGEICAHWGNELFSPPVRRASAQIAAAMHDEGWREADESPLFHRDEGRPLHFLEIDMQNHVPLYRRGVERIYRHDPYAGLLVSMHWTGLYRRRWGSQGGGVFLHRGPTAAQRLQDEAVDEQERAWIAVKRELIGDQPRSEFEADLWHSYDLLQAFDLLSLYLCVGNLTHCGTEPRAVAQTLGAIEQEPGPRVIESVPTRTGGKRLSLVLTPASDGVVTVDPYPFDAQLIDLSVSGRAISDHRYESEDDVRTALDEAADVVLTRRISPALR
jgi:Protein of unknown function (DUF3891)